jgi:spermidine synthase
MVLNKIFLSFTAIVTGFVFLSFEILFLRIFSVATKSKPMVFGIVLGIFLLGLGLGAADAKVKLQKSKTNIQMYIFQLLLLSAFLFYLVIPGTANLSSQWFYAYWYGLILVGIAAFFSGGILPLIVSSFVKEESMAGLGVAHIYGANIGGSALGSFLTGFYFLDIFSAAQLSLLMCVLLLLWSILFVISTSF